MAELLAGFLTSAIVGTAKEKLGSAILEKAKLLWNFDDDLKDMKDKLETISAALEDAERRSVKEKLVQLWMKRLKDAAFDISDMLEDYEDTSDQPTAKRPRVLSCLAMAPEKIDVANRMMSIREELRKINMDFEMFKFTPGTSTTTTEQHYDKRESTSYLPKNPIIGRHKEMQDIINLLSASTNNDETVIVPIYGLGGMGKSTLAQQVYNNSQFKEYDHRIWVYVSQDFNLKNIGRSIISQLPIVEGQQNCNSSTLQVIQQYLAERLRGKKVLVILDDLWEENMAELERLRSMLHATGSTMDVIVTTRKEEIARTVSTSEPYRLHPLEDGICWEIIKRSSKFELKSNQEKLEQIGLDIAKKCGGVALAAQTIGFMLQSIHDLSGWTNINNNDIWKENSEDNDVLPSLKLSYEAMPPQLRICFSYCAIFSKGHTIVEDDLVHQWIALDFIERSKGKEYIKKLLGMSFLQVSKLPSTSEEHVVRYTMHDLVHDLARLTMADELIVSDAAPDRDTRGQKYCRYSLLGKYDRTAKLANILPSKIRALRFSDSGELDIPSGAFSFAKCLRTLDFSECSGILLPASIGKLRQLRCLIAPRMQNKCLPECITELSKLQYLNINGSQISTLPGSIGKLGCLQYLDLSGCSGISKLPESFGDLKCMVHLGMSGCSGIRELPDSLGNLTNLQHLELSECSSIKEIPNSLWRLTQLQHLNLSSCRRLVRLPEAIGSLINIEYLNMSRCREITELPVSMNKLQNLLHLDLSYCEFQKESLVEGLRSLTALQHLDMSWIDPRSDFSGHEEVSDVLRNLTNLKYLSLRNSMSWLFSCTLDFIGTLTNLEHLDLSRQHYFNLCLPESIGNLKRLRTLDVSYCSDLESLPESIGELGLTSLGVEGCLAALLDQATSLLHYSLTLPIFKVRADDDVNGCSNLHLLEGVHVSELKLHSLQNVRSLEEADKIKLLDKHNLSELSLSWSYDADRLLEDNDLLRHLVPPRGLKHMCLDGYSSTSFPGWLMDISHHLTNLVSINLKHLPKCRSLPPLGQLPHLEALNLWDLPRITEIDREFCGGKGAFRRLARFSIREMDGLEEWNTTYSSEDGVEEFMFPVLDRLTIDRCELLRLEPCAPKFRECSIVWSEGVISSLEELGTISQYCSSTSSRATKLESMDLCCQSLELQGSVFEKPLKSMEIFHHFPALQELRISDSNLRSLPESMRHLTSLQSLKLSRCDYISALPEWLGELSSLESLVISGGRDIDSLPESMRHLTSLQSLKLQYCHSISALPEWLGDLSSLESLVIWSCKGIKSLPSCIQQLTKLKKLRVSGNRELKTWCESEENKTKLAHIITVKVL